MRLAVTVNGTSRVLAAVKAPSYLGTHLNLSDRPEGSAKTLQVSGVQTLETETIYLEWWPNLDLQIGDVVEIRLLDDGEADEPTMVKMSSESPRNLFSRSDLAKELVNLVSEFESRLTELLEKSEQMESAEEHKRFKTALGNVLAELGDSFLYPIYRRHKELMPDQLKGELL